jgi:hypothetical protein
LQNFPEGVVNLKVPFARYLLFSSLALPAISHAQAPTSTAAPSTTQTAPSTASAVPANNAPKAAPTPQPIKLGKNTTLSINIRTRVESWDYFQGEAAPGGNAGDGSYTFLGNLIRLGVLNSTPKRDLQFELSQPTLLGLPDDAVASGPGTTGQGQLGLGANYFVANGKKNDASLFVKQVFVRFKNLGGTGNSLRLGRFEFIDGTEVMPKDPTLAWLKRERIAHRLIGNFGFSHVQRSFDGAQFVWNNPKNNITIAAIRPTAGVFDLDANGNIGDVSTVYAAWTKPGATSDMRVFGALYRDSRNDVVKVDNRPLPVRTADTDSISIPTLGAHYLKTFEAGNGTADLLLWGALQRGDWGEDEHRASAFAIEAGYQPKMKWRPWLRAGFYKGSGDDNPNDGKHQTFFQMLPTPRIYARTPFYNGMNNRDLWAQLILRPDAKTTVRADYHNLKLDNSNDLYYAGGGVFQHDSFGYAGRPSLGGKGLANLFDISFDRQLNARTTLSLYLGIAKGKGVISNIYKDDTARFGFVEISQKF